MPIVVGKVESVTTKILIDSGSQLCCVSRNFFEEIKVKGDVPLLPVANFTIVGALKGKRQRIKNQIYLNCEVQGAKFDCVCLVVPSLTWNVVLGCDWLAKYSINICFDTFKIFGKFLNNVKTVRI